MDTTRRGFLGLLAGAGVAPSEPAKAAAAVAPLPAASGLVNAFQSMALQAAAAAVHELRHFRGERFVSRPFHTGHSVHIDGGLSINLSEWQQAITTMQCVSDCFNPLKRRTYADDVGGRLGAHISGTLAGATHVVTAPAYASGPWTDVLTKEIILDIDLVALRAMLWPEHHQWKFALDCVWGYLPNVPVESTAVLHGREGVVADTVTIDGRPATFKIVDEG